VHIFMSKLVNVLNRYEIGITLIYRKLLLMSTFIKTKFQNFNPGKICISILKLSSVIWIL